MSNHKLTVANLCVKSNSMWTNFADNGNKRLCMYNVYTMYTTAVGVILARQLARLFAPKWIRYLMQRLLDTVCTMYVRCMYARWRLVNDWRRFIANVLVWKCSVRFAHTAHASLMGAYAPKRSANRALSWEGRRVVSGDDKLITANLCDRKKPPRFARWCYDSSMSLRNSRLVFRRLYFVSPITPCPVW